MNATRRPRGTRAPAVRRLIEVFRDRLSALEHIDFFGSTGRDIVVSLMAQLEERAHPAPPSPGPASAADTTVYTRRLWVTRPRPGVDRMGSAWLIRRFVDAGGRFGFAVDRESLPADAIPFDMFGVDFSHQGDGCTFETLCAVFGIRDPAVARIAAIVHDLDLKDGRFGAPEATTVGTLIEGLQLATADDDTLLERGSRCSNRCSAPSRSRGERRALDQRRRLALVPRRPRARDAPPPGAVPADDFQGA